MTVETSSPGVVLKNADGKALAVRAVTHHVVVDGPVSRVRTEVTFNHDLENTGPIEGDLVFPLPPFSSLADLNVKVGEREIVGKFKPRERAQADYHRAVSAGQTAALGESEGEDMTRLRVAPIAPGEDVVATLVIVYPLTAIGDGHRLIVPLTYMPRYVEDPAGLKPTEAAAVDRPRPATLAARANVSIEVRSLSGRAPSIRCTTHPTAIAASEGATIVTVKDEPLDRDLVVEIIDKPEGQDPVVWVRHDATEGADKGGPATAVALIPPQFAEESGKTIARSVIVLIDRSGSMGGAPMEAAKRAAKGILRALGPTDRFNLIAFESAMSSLAQAPVEFSEANLKAADSFIDGLHAGGGTEASRAIQAALSGTAAQFGPVVLKEGAPPDPSLRMQVIIMLTDGDVSSCDRVIKSARDRMHDTRLYTVGIGDSVNHATLAYLAELGRGLYTPVRADGSDLEDEIGKIKSRIDAPLITGVQVRIDEDGEVRDAPRPESLGALDLFAAEPMLVAFRGALKPGAVLVISGQRAGGEDYRVRVPLLAPQDEPAGTVASTMWAMLRNKRLTYKFNPEDDAALEELGVAFGLVNRRTALVGIHEENRGLSTPETVPVVLPMPRNIAAASGVATSGGGHLLYSAAPVACAAGVPGTYTAQSMMLGGAASIPSGAMRSSRGLARSATLSASVGPKLESMVLERSTGAESFLSSDAGDEGVLSSDLLDTSFSASPSEISESNWGGGSAKSISVPGRFSDDIAGLRSLMLTQDAGGLFGGSLSATLAAACALAKRGHTAREGQFKAELRRTMQALNSRLPSLFNDDRAMAEATLAVLRGEKIPQDVDSLLSYPLDPLASEILASLA